MFNAIAFIAAIAILPNYVPVSHRAVSFIPLIGWALDNLMQQLIYAAVHKRSSCERRLRPFSAGLFVRAQETLIIRVAV
jgi:hypothetical protein